MRRTRAACAIAVVAAMTVAGVGAAGAGQSGDDRRAAQILDALPLVPQSVLNDIAHENWKKVYPRLASAR